MTEDERLIGQLLSPPFWSSKLRPPGQLIGTKDQCLPPPTTSAVPTEPLSSPPKRTILVFCPSGTHALWYALGTLSTKLKLKQAVFVLPQVKVFRPLCHARPPSYTSVRSWVAGDPASFSVATTNHNCGRWGGKKGSSVPVPHWRRSHAKEKGRGETNLE